MYYLRQMDGKKCVLTREREKNMFSIIGDGLSVQCAPSRWLQRNENHLLKEKIFECMRLKCKTKEKFPIKTKLVKATTATANMNTIRSGFVHLLFSSAGCRMLLSSLLFFFFFYSFFLWPLERAHFSFSQEDFLGRPVIHRRLCKNTENSRRKKRCVQNKDASKQTTCYS